MPTIDPADEFDKLVFGGGFSVEEQTTIADLERQLRITEAQTPKGRGLRREKGGIIPKKDKPRKMKCRWCGEKIPQTSKFVQTSGGRGPVHYECLQDWLDFHEEGMNEVL